MKLKGDNLLHYTMAIAGGFFGCYSILFLAEICASSQTLNLISVVIRLFSGDFWTVFLRLMGMLLYASALVLSVVIPRLTKINGEYLSVIIDFAALTTLAFLPKSLPPLIGIFPVIFAMAYQWAVFDLIEGYSSSTIFSTNNFRQFVTALTAYRIDKDRKMLDKARVFGFTLVCYYTGVAYCCATCLPLGRAGSFFGMAPLVFALFLLIGKSINRKK